ncbi:MAG: lysine exporter LysO family protein [Firmicutes bacterium]|nr:lysine exporter LysO family protein [Bacillota bacterium]
MIIALILVLVAGVFLGAQPFSMEFVDLIEVSGDYTLFLLLFLIGAELASSGNLRERFKSLDISMLFLPLFSILGSLFAGAMTGLLTQVGLWQGAAIGGGMGWYSLSGVIISQKLSAELGALAFLTNIFREIYTFIFIPLLYKFKLGPAALTIGGATTMDTTLPIINRYLGKDLSLIAIWHGIVCSLLVPVLVSLMLMPL